MEQVHDEMVALGSELILQRAARCGLLEQLLGARKRVRRHRGETLGQPQRFGERLPAAGDGADQPPIGQLLRRHRLAEPQHLLHTLARQCLHQAPRRAAVGRQADAPVREDESRILGCDDQVAGEREREAGACRRAVDRRDHGLRERPQCFDELMQVFEHLDLRGWTGTAPLQQPLQIAAGTEVPAGAAQDGGPQFVIGFRDVERFDPGRDHLM